MDSLSVKSRAALGRGLLGGRIQTEALALIGGWSRELERCTTAPLLVESVKLNVEAERDIWRHMEQGFTRHEGKPQQPSRRGRPQGDKKRPHKSLECWDSLNNIRGHRILVYFHPPVFGHTGTLEV